MDEEEEQEKFARRRKEKLTTPYGSKKKKKEKLTKNRGLEFFFGLFLRFFVFLNLNNIYFVLFF